MKKIYITPCVEIEKYELDKSIAIGCDPVIDLGPGYPGETACKNWHENGDFGEEIPKISMYTDSGHKSFYDNVPNCGCDCKYTAGNSGYFKS